MAVSKELQAHLDTGHTNLCRCWAVLRNDGREFGFTDHDLDLWFDGVVFKANSGLTSMALQQTTGLAVDNSEALGVLSDAAVTEADIQAGRFDGANVRSWLVNWTDTSQRLMLFNGSIGEISYSSGSFNAELRGLTEALNQPQGRIYQKPCSAVLGDSRCKFSFDVPGYQAELQVETVEDQRIFTFGKMNGFEHQWFERGRLSVLSGDATGLVGLIKNDRLTGESRSVELWDALRAPIAEGDLIRLEVGCDKRAKTCRLKFNNFLNFRGFPDIPGDDWLASYPQRAGLNTGESLTR